MSAYPLRTQRLLTVSEYLSLGEDADGQRTELMEGTLVMSLSPTPDHSVAILSFATLFRQVLPDHLEVLSDTDVDLELAPPDKPGTCRRPDVLVTHRSARKRVRAEGGVLNPADLVLAVEVVSPGSGRTDHIVKRAEYQDSGVPFYWVVDVDENVSLVAYRLTEEFGYVESAKATVTYTTDEPFPVTVDLEHLV